jgi:hypothetical protein
LKKREIDSDRFIEMYNSGATHAQLCVEFDICADTLRKQIRELGLPRRREPVSIDIDEFRCAYYEGLSSYKLSEKFGICRSTVRSLVKKLKLRENELAVKATRKAQNPMECYAQI